MENNRVRFRSEAGLVQVRELPDTEVEDAARQGEWGAAPPEDPIWDGFGFRERELSVDEMAQVLRERGQSRRKSVWSLYSLFHKPTDYKSKVLEDLALQGSYKDPLEEEATTGEESNDGTAEERMLLEDNDMQEEEERAKVHKKRDSKRMYSNNHRRDIPLRPVLKTSKWYIETHGGDLQNQEHSPRKRKRDSLRNRRLRAQLRRALRTLRDGTLLSIALFTILFLCALVFTVLRKYARVRNRWVNLAIAVCLVATLLISVVKIVSFLPRSARKVVQYYFNRL